MSTSGVVTTVRRRLLGLALLMTIVLFLGLTVATYKKAFSSTVDVQLKAASTGNQLQPDSDVKVRGVIVGSVRNIQATGNGALMTLALDPQKAKEIPANVSARLLPKTLFGERFVSLEMPKKASSAKIAAGDTIEQDHTKSSIELEKVLSDMMPVLQAVHPQDLASTLNALDKALDGRGKPLGETLSQLNTYVAGLNPALPDLQQNMRQLVGVANTYNDAAPDVLSALQNLSTTSRTLVEQRQNLAALTSQVTTTSQDMTSFVRANQRNLIRLGEVSRPTLDVLRRYSPGFPCFLNTMTRLKPKEDALFGKGTDQPGLHITLEVTQNRGKYTPGEEPRFTDNRGPRCLDDRYWGKPVPQYPSDGPVQDGSKAPPGSRMGAYPPGAIPDDNSPPPPDGDQSQQSNAPAGNSPQSSGPASTSPQSAGLGMVNSPAERDLVSTLLAPSYGVAPADVPQWGTLLVGPLLRGGEVSYR